MNAHQSQSGLSRSLDWFSKCVAATGAFLLAPLVTQHFRVEMLRYLLDAFRYDVAYYGSWVFVGVVVLAAFFGIATLTQLLIHALIRWGARRSVF